MSTLSSTVFFKIDEWVRPGLATGHHVDTLEHVLIKISADNSLFSEARILEALSGGIGIPKLYWFEAAQGESIMVTELPGHSLEDIFERCGRNFDLPLLMLLGEQLVSRVEWLHLHQIFHGTLSPASFSIGSSNWQSPQLVVQEMRASGLSAKEDLQALYHIILYFTTASSSWESYKSCPANIEIPPPLERFSRMVTLDINPADYHGLREIFREAYQSLSVITLIGSPDPGRDTLTLRDLAQIRSAAIFDSLGESQSCAGSLVPTSAAPWDVETGRALMSHLDDIFIRYMVLLLRDNPTQVRMRYMRGAYHLPNKLWRDLRWFLFKAQSGPLAFRDAIPRAIFKFVGVLLDILPAYEADWMKLLSQIAYTQMNMKDDNSAEWRQAWVYWKLRANSVIS